MKELAYLDNDGELLEIVDESARENISDLQEVEKQHEENKSNPHGVTKTQVGLGDVDNTSDINKPVSTAQQRAIDEAYANSNYYTDNEIAKLIGAAPHTLDTLEEIANAMADNDDVVTALEEAIGKKANESEFKSHANNTSNPHGVTKSQVGLGNVPNVKTNDQTPTYSEATELSPLTSGEKLSIAFGKLAKAVSDLILHNTLIGSATLLPYPNSSIAYNVQQAYQAIHKQCYPSLESALEFIGLTKPKSKMTTAELFDLVPVRTTLTFFTVVEIITDLPSTGVIELIKGYSESNLCYAICHGTNGRLYHYKFHEDPTTNNGWVGICKESDLVFTENRVMCSNENGKLATSSITTAELYQLLGVESNIQNQINAKAKTNHASSTPDYGLGTGAVYGHLKLSDVTNSEKSVSDGTAATPKAVKAAYDLASGVKSVVGEQSNLPYPNSTFAYNVQQAYQAIHKQCYPSLESALEFIGLTKPKSKMTTAELFDLVPVRTTLTFFTVVEIITDLPSTGVIELIKGYSESNLCYAICHGTNGRLYHYKFHEDPTTNNGWVGICKESDLVFTENRVMCSNENGKLATSSITTAELYQLLGVESNIQNQINAKAKTNHASSTPDYGLGTGAVYGHLKLSDVTNSEKSVSDGTAATPKAVKAAYDLASGVNDNIRSYLTECTINTPSFSSNGYVSTTDTSSFVRYYNVGIMTCLQVSLLVTTEIPVQTAINLITGLPSANISTLGVLTDLNGESYTVQIDTNGVNLHTYSGNKKVIAANTRLIGNIWYRRNTL